MSVTARKINVKFFIDGEKFPVSSLNFKNSVNNIPTATVEFGVPNAQKATKIRNKSFVQGSTKFFEQVFRPSGGKFTTSTVEMINENNNETFTGILGNVKTVFSTSYVGLSATIFHKYQLFSFIDLSIYALESTDFFTAVEGGDKQFTASLSNIEGSLASRIQQIIKKVADEKFLKPKKSDVAGLEEAKQQHEMNIELLEIFYEFLNNSDDEKSEFIGQDLLDNDEEFKINSINLNTRIVQNLVDSGVNLWRGLIDKLLPTFLMDVALDNEQQGRFYRLDKGRLKDRLTAPVIRVAWSGGDVSSQPLAGVLVINDLNNKLYNNTDKGTKSNIIIARYPKEIVAFGTLKTINTPYWMKVDGFSAPLREASKTLKQIEEDESVTFEEFSAYLERNDKTQENKNLKRQKFANDYAKLHYENLRYRNSIATVEIPFDPRARPGAIFRFTAEGEDVNLFDGYLRTVSQTIKLDNNGAEAYTSLTFNQVGKTFIED